MKPNFFIFFLISAFLWSLTFICRLIFIDDLHVSPGSYTEMTPDIFFNLSNAYNQGDKWEVFLLIFGNNLKSCIFNILGGVLLGLGTLINLLMNGFITADMFYNTFINGMSVSQIIQHTLPHSIELIGIWLSGATGFYIANILWFLIQNKKVDIGYFVNIIFKSMLSTVLIILLSAVLEAYVSVP